MMMKRRTLKYLISISILLLSLIALSGLYIAFRPHQWESAIQVYEAQDLQHPPQLGSVLFVGSSTIRLWTALSTDFPDIAVLNRGFGGAQMHDLLFFADRIMLPYRPKLILIYAGDNDIYFGKSPEQVCAEFRTLVQKIRASLPDARIAFLSVKPSLQRWKKAAEMQRANALIRAYIQTESHLDYLDLFSPMLGSDGKPRRELFAEDGLHLNQAGYRLWTQILEPYLTKFVDISR